MNDAYLLGISEGRDFLNFELANGETDVAELARQMIDTIERNLARGFGGEMRQHMLGERDFWRNQLKKFGRQ
jgi:hypothetical protein